MAVWCAECLVVPYWWWWWCVLAAAVILATAASGSEDVWYRRRPGKAKRMEDKAEGFVDEEQMVGEMLLQRRRN
jgi:hypothetical protein